MIHFAGSLGLNEADLKNVETAARAHSEIRSGTEALLAEISGMNQ